MNVKKGTTIVVLVCKNGVVFAADKQATAGSIIASRTTRKIFQVDDCIAVSVAGSLGDAQNLVSLLKAEIALRKMEEKHLNVKAVASLTARILHEHRLFPYITWLLLAGYNNDGSPQAFSIDLFGGLHTDSYIAQGSGMQVAHGVLETAFEEGLDLEEGINVAARSIRAARERDLGTGGGIAVCVITPAGYEELSENEIHKRLEKL